MPDYSYDLFLSYARADAPWVRSFLTPALGLPAERIIQLSDFRPGASPLEELERAVKNSRYTCLILSPAFLADQWASLGEQLAAYLGVAGQSERVIPLVLHACELPLHIDFRVKLDCIDEDEWNEQIGRLRGLFDVADPGVETLPCPYPGMVPFTSDLANAFYGREEEIDFMLEHLRHQKFLLVVGASGSGKSSLITAGLIPKLEGSGYFQKRPWLVVGPIRPGATPWQSLTEALGGDPGDINSRVNEFLAAHPGRGRVLLVVDQFEEIFTQGEHEEQRRFIAALKRLREHDAAAVIVAMRADFYADLLKSDLWPIDPSQRLDVGPLKGDALRRAIEKPAEDKGVYIEGRLVDKLMADADDAPGVLPLLQETLVQLWEHRLRRFLPYSAYAALGGGKGNGLAAAIAHKADSTLADMADPTCGDGDISRRIFLRLVQFGEGRTDTRRQQPVAALISEGDTSDLFDRTLSHLSDNRLIALSGGEATTAGGSERRADIAHEALFLSWPTLTGWIVTYRDDEQQRRRLDDMAADWAGSGRSAGRLLVEDELTQAAAWLARDAAKAVGHSPELSELVAASLTKEALVRKQQEAARRQKLVMTIGLVVAVVLLILLWGVFQTETARAEIANRATADAARQLSDAARATAEANRLLALRNESQAWAQVARQDLQTDPVASLWWSSRALPSAANPRPAVAEAEYQMRSAMQQDLEVAYANVFGTSAITGVTTGLVDASGPFIAVGRPEVTLWSHELGAPLKRLTDAVDGLRWQSDGALFTYAGSKLTVWRNDVAFRYDLPAALDGFAWRPAMQDVALISGRRQVSLWSYAHGDPQVLTVFPSDIELRPGYTPLAWSSDGSSLAAWDNGGDLLLYGGPLPGDPPTSTLKLPAPVADAAWSPDGQSLVALLGDGRGLVLSGDLALAAAQPFTTSLAADASRTFGGVVFRDADHFITWGLAAPPRLWSLTDLTAPEHVYTLRTAAIAGVSLAPDGARFAAFGENGDVELYRYDEEQPLHLQGHSRFVNIAAWNGDFLATGGSDGAVLVWDLREDAPRRELMALAAVPAGTPLGRSYISALEWRSGGRLLAVGEDGSARIWRILDGDGAPLCSGRAQDDPPLIPCAADSRALRGHDIDLRDLHWLDATTLLSVDRDGAARRWELASAETRLLPADPNETRRAVFSPDGAQLFTYRDPQGPDGAGEGALWDVTTGRLLAPVHGPIEWAAWVSPGLFVGRPGDSPVRVDPATGADLAPLPGELKSETVNAVAANGATLTAGTSTGSLYIRQGVGAQPLILSFSPDSIKYIAFSPGGNRVATVGSVVGLWDLAKPKGDAVSTRSNSGFACAPAFSPDGALLAACLGSTFYVWDAATRKELWSTDAAGMETAKGVAWRTAPNFDGSGTRTLLLTWAKDTAQLWDWDARQPVAAFREPPELNLAAISPEGQWLATTDDAGTIRLWHLSLEDPQGLLQLAAERMTRKMDEQESNGG